MYALLKYMCMRMLHVIVILIMHKQFNCQYTMNMIICKQILITGGGQKLRTSRDVLSVADSIFK